MLKSPLFRRTMISLVGYGLFCLMTLSLVCLSVSTASGLSDLKWRFMVAATILILFGLGLVIHGLQRWIVPLVNLTQASAVLASGKRPGRLFIEDDNEFGRLANAFHEMSQAVEARYSESVSSQQRMKRENEQLATVLEAMVEGVIAVDREERILHANTAAIRLLDLKAFNIVGRRTWECIRLTQVNQLIGSILEDNREQMRKEIEVPWTQSIVVVVASRLPGIPCPGAVLVLHDVTDLRRLENLRREFVSNVSHELKTPLASITACAETLLDSALEDPVFGRKFVLRISEQAERLNKLIFDLLELARIESGEHELQLASVELSAIVTASVDAHMDIAESKQLMLSTRFDKTQIWVQGNSDGLRTICDNLIGNAINYSHPGGKVTIDFQSDPDWIRFSVTDTGVGIAEEFQTRIFERFFRVDRARSREVGGTGLGLSIVKHLCQLFGGSIKVSSQLNQGSTFTVQLVRVEQPSEQIEAAQLNEKNLLSK